MNHKRRKPKVHDVRLDYGECKASVAREMQAEEAPRHKPRRGGRRPYTIEVLKCVFPYRRGQYEWRVRGRYATARDRDNALKTLSRNFCNVFESAPQMRIGGPDIDAECAA